MPRGISWKPLEVPLFEVESAAVDDGCAGSSTVRAWRGKWRGHELPTKLLVTQELLGCASRKELCARFRDVNPRTEFDLERSHKWMQGRAKPRSGRVYEDG